MPVRAGITPTFTNIPAEKIIASSLPTNLASLCSSSTCISRVPFKKRLPAIPVPYFLVAAMAASFTFGWLVSPKYEFEPNISTLRPLITTSVSCSLDIALKYGYIPASLVFCGASYFISFCCNSLITKLFCLHYTMSFFRKNECKFTLFFPIIH